MNLERFAAIKHLFAAVAEVAPDARAESLRELTDDTEVIGEVLALHAASTSTTAVWKPIASELRRAVRRQIVPGDTLGVWRIESEIAHGGMGKVFLAERNDGHFRQRAALKLLAGVPSPEMLVLFTRERQLLATLSHPNIARLLDGGATAENQPFLVMEYVAGSHIDEHCRRERLGVRAVLALFLTSCDAVAFAHRQLVVHCDLKPSNLLIDGDGRPVLMDFGIARLIGRVEVEAGTADDDDHAYHAADDDANTEPAPLAFTPRYASPEQKAHEAVSTASDIYSLGVLLGELLAGAADRPRLPPLQRQELAAIVDQATRRDPAARYATVDALTADIRRFLDQRPVRAFHGSTGYAARKALLRHYPAAAAALLLTAILAAAATEVMIESGRARAAERRAVQERNRAAKAEAASRQTNEFLVSIFKASNPDSKIAAVPTSTLIAQAEARLEKELDGQPIALSDIHGALARVQVNLANHRKAREHFLRAIAIERGLNRPLALAALLQGMTTLRLASADPEAGLADATEALALFERHAGPAAAETILARGQIADIHRHARRYRAAMPYVLQNLGIVERGSPTVALAVGLDELGLLLFHEARYDSAIAAASRALDLYAQLEGKESYDYIGELENLGRTLSAARRFDAAEAALRAAWEGHRKRAGAETPSAGWALEELAHMMLDAGRSREAIPLFQEAIGILDRSQGPVSPSVGVMANNLALADYTAGDVRAARREWERSIAILARADSEGSIALERNHFAWFLTSTGSLDAAWPQIAAALKARLAMVGEKHPDTSFTRTVLAQWYRKSGQPARALAILESMRPLEPSWDLPQRAYFERQVALARAMRGRNEEAFAGLAEAERLERRYYGDADPRTWLNKVDRAELLAHGTREQRAEGAALASAILAHVKDALVPGAPVLAHLKELGARSGGSTALADLWP